MNKPLSKETREANERFRYENGPSFESKELIAKIPDDSKDAYVVQCESWEEAQSIRMELYNLRRSVRSYKYFRPDIGDKVARFVASVQGTTLVLRLRPSRYFSAVVAKAVETGQVVERYIKPVNLDPTESEDGLRSLTEAFEFPAVEDEPQPTRAFAPEDDPFEIAMRKMQESKKDEK